MAEKVSNIKVCSPLKLRSGLTGKFHAICHYSYNLPLTNIIRRNMKQTFKIGKGELSFDEEKIVIKDDARKQNRLILITSCIWIVYGILSVLRYFKTGDQFLLWTGLLIGIAHLIVVVLMLLRTSKNEVRKSEIKSLEIKERFGRTFLDINLVGFKFRRVIRIENGDELKKFIETYLETK